MRAIPKLLHRHAAKDARRWRRPTALFRNRSRWCRSAKPDASCQRLGEACRDSIGTCSHFHTSQAQKSSNRGESLTPCLCLVLSQPTMIQNSRLHHSPWLWPWILSKKSCRCAAIRSNRAKRRTLHRFLSKLLQRPRPTERPHLPTKPRIGATQAFSIQPTILMR